MSQTSLTIRQRLACVLMCSASAGGVGPGEVLSTIGRPQPSMARRISSISSLWYGEERSSILM